MLYSKNNTFFHAEFTEFSCRIKVFNAVRGVKKEFTSQENQFSEIIAMVYYILLLFY